MEKDLVATVNAGKLRGLFRSLENLEMVFLVGFLFLCLSCTKSEEVEIIDNGAIENETPGVDDNPVGENPNDNPDIDEEPFVDEVVVIYTDIDPDFTNYNSGNSYELDLNNDQIVDFSIGRAWDGYDNKEWLGIASTPQAENGILSVAPWYVHPVPLPSGKIISKGGYRNGEFYNKDGTFTLGDCFANEPDCFYDWQVKGDKYLGLRFYINGKRHFGWARLEIINSTNWIVKDYAYNAIPNNGILAGQLE